MRRIVFYAALTMAVFLLATAVSQGTAQAAQGDARITQILPGKAVLKSGYGVDALYLSGNGYRDLEQKPLAVSFTVDGLRLDKPLKRLVEGYWMQRVEITPVAGGAEVTVGRALNARGLALAVSPQSRFIPGTPNVVLSLTVGEGAKKDGYAAESTEIATAEESAGTTAPPSETVPDADYPVLPVVVAEAGKYQFPPEKRKYKYSDVLVSFNLVNTDFREVLMLMSEIGNVSIVLDPYWEDEPTGGRRRPGGPGGLGGGGGEGGGGGGGEQTSGGFRDAGTFQAQLPRQGAGNLTMNLEGVPFDLALDLILTAVNLEKIDIYPGFFDQPQAALDQPTRR